MSTLLERTPLQREQLIKTDTCCLKSLLTPLDMLFILYKAHTTLRRTHVAWSPCLIDGESYSSVLYEADTSLRQTLKQETKCFHLGESLQRNLQ